MFTEWEKSIRPNVSKGEREREKNKKESDKRKISAKAYDSNRNQHRHYYKFTILLASNPHSAHNMHRIIHVDCRTATKIAVYYS